MRERRVGKRPYVRAELLSAVLLAVHAACLGAAPLPGAKSLTVEKIVETAQDERFTPQEFRWSPDGRQLTYLLFHQSESKISAELWAVQAATGARRPLITADHMPRMEWFAPEQDRTGVTYQWSPDGSSILFEGGGSLVLVDLQTQSQHKLINGNSEIENAQFSPDGRWISFIKDHNIWLAAAKSAAVRPLTKVGWEGVRNGETDKAYAQAFAMNTAYWWAPDSSAIAYLESDEREVTKYPLLQFETGQAQVPDLMWERFPTPGGHIPVLHLVVASVRNDWKREIDLGANHEFYIPHVLWCPDSRSLAVERLNRLQTNRDLLMADARTGATHVVLRETDPYWINPTHDLVFLHNGRQFLWSSERSGYRHLYLYDIDGSGGRPLTSGKWQVTSVAGVDESENRVYFVATAKTPLERQLYRVSLDGTGLEQVTHENGWHTVLFAPGVKYFLDSFSDAMFPPTQQLVRADGSVAALIHKRKPIQRDGYLVSTAEFFQIRAHDGAGLNAMMMKPVGFRSSQRYPVLIYVYGGPGGQAVCNRWNGMISLWHEMMAEQGFIVFAVDNRGSGGYGHVFEQPIHLRIGAQEISDQRDGITYLRSLPYVDSSRIGIWGDGYGGQLALRALLEDPQDIRASFAESPIVDWSLCDAMSAERYLGLPANHENEYEESSPLDEVAGMKGKLLVAASADDQLIHFAQTMRLQQELVKAQKYAEVMPFANGPDGISGASQVTVLLRRATDFFMANLAR